MADYTDYHINCYIDIYDPQYKEIVRCIDWLCNGQSRQLPEPPHGIKSPYWNRISWAKKYLKSKDGHDYDNFIAQSQFFIEFTDPEITGLVSDLAIIKEIYDLSAAYEDQFKIESKVIAKSINDKAHLEISSHEQKWVVKLIDCQSESKGIIIHAHSEIYLSSVAAAKQVQSFINQLILILNKFGKDSPITKYHALIK